MLADRRRLRGGERHPHPLRRRALCNLPFAPKARHPKRDPAAARALLGCLDETGDLDALERGGEHGMGDALHLERGNRETRRDGGQQGKHVEAEGMCAQGDRQPEETRHRYQPDIRQGLMRGPEIERSAGCDGDRQKQEAAPVLQFAREAAGQTGEKRGVERVQGRQKCQRP